MRKIDLDNLYEKFESEAHFIRDLYLVTKGLYGELRERDAYLSKLSELCFHKLYVAYEIYISNLFVGLINKDSQNYQQWLFNKALQQVSVGVPIWVKSGITFKPVKHLTVEQARKAIDPNGFNKTFSTAGDMVKFARGKISAVSGRNINSLSQPDRNLINSCIAMRNFIAHESASSRSTMNSQLRKINIGGGNAGLDRQAREVHKVGAYMRSIVNGQSRLEVYVSRLCVIAHSLKP
ncbi:hypothetical protein QN399_16260 [Pseudomonas sp. 10C3]|uniref:hypothetical protein n=1 Tax=Pseudomonas sp. 10C3 TaxID=3118753 RepID=UPI002E804064|nr:hypothetical protein [Pseudomonas sp. 10C3]MEE3507790.1 hypothetical protein [Pseudomonas sp. 10C3]